MPYIEAPYDLSEHIGDICTNEYVKLKSNRQEVVEEPDHQSLFNKDTANRYRFNESFLPERYGIRYDS